MLLNDCLCGTICTYPKVGSTEVSTIPNTHICDLGGGGVDVLNDPKEIMLAHANEIIILLIFIRIVLYLWLVPEQRFIYLDNLARTSQLNWVLKQFGGTHFPNH